MQIDVPRFQQRCRKVTRQYGHICWRPRHSSTGWRLSCMRSAPLHTLSITTKAGGTSSTRCHEPHMSPLCSPNLRPMQHTSLQTMVMQPTCITNTQLYVHTHPVLSKNQIHSGGKTEGAQPWHRLRIMLGRQKKCLKLHVGWQPAEYKQDAPRLTILPQTVAGCCCRCRVQTCIATKKQDVYDTC